MFGYFSEPYLGYGRMLASLCRGGDVVAYGRRLLSHPHRSDRKKKGGKAKAKRRAKSKRLHEQKWQKGARK